MDSGESLRKVDWLSAYISLKWWDVPSTVGMTLAASSWGITFDTMKHDRSGQTQVGEHPPSCSGYGMVDKAYIREALRQG